MPPAAPIGDEADLVRDAFARGQTALSHGDRAGAVRWLDRARRLAPADGTIRLALASALIGLDNRRAADLFDGVADTEGTREAFLGLITARFLMGDMPAARAALAATLSRHTPHTDLRPLANHVVSATEAPGWCGLSGDGTLIVHCPGPDLPEARIDGKPLDAGIPPDAWPCAREVTVTVAGHHLIGSPISVPAIGQVAGFLKAGDDGLHGWAWHPGAPDTDPVLNVTTGPHRITWTVTTPAEGISGLPPLARPRAFFIPWSILPKGRAGIHVRGRDGRDLPGSPMARGSSARARTNDQSPVTIPLTPARRPVDLAGWRADRRPSVILITHDDGGGVERQVQDSAAAHEANGHRVIILRPQDAGMGVAVTDGTRRLFPDLRFALPRERQALLCFLSTSRPVAVEVHHFLNHAPTLFDTLRALNVPYDTYVHDYIWFCPRIALVGKGDTYCGEPSLKACETCVAETGTYLNEDISVRALLSRSGEVLRAARRVIAPSRDAAIRMRRHFPRLRVTVVPHDDDEGIAEPPPIPIVAGTVHVCVAGAIGLHKGFHVLLACARDAQEHGLDLTFTVVGTTIDDRVLIDTGRVFVTGRYAPEEAVALIRAQSAHLAFLPSIWPETWNLGLTELWRAGLRVAAFDLGAPAERIRQTGRGFLLPLGLSPGAINDALLKAVRGRSFLPIRRSSAYNASTNATLSK